MTRTYTVHVNTETGVHTLSVTVSGGPRAALAEARFLLALAGRRGDVYLGF